MVFRMGTVDGQMCRALVGMFNKLVRNRMTVLRGVTMVDVMHMELHSLSAHNGQHQQYGAATPHQLVNFSENLHPASLAVGGRKGNYVVMRVEVGKHRWPREFLAGVSLEPSIRACYSNSRVRRFAPTGGSGRGAVQRE